MNEEQTVSFVYATDRYTAVLRGDSMSVYDSDGDELLSLWYYGDPPVTDMGTLRLLLSARSRGFADGEKVGKFRAQQEMRNALGI